MQSTRKIMIGAFEYDDRLPTTQAGTIVYRNAPQRFATQDPWLGSYL